MRLRIHSPELASFAEEGRFYPRLRDIVEVSGEEATQKITLSGCIIENRPSLERPEYRFNSYTRRMYKAGYGITELHVGIPQEKFEEIREALHEAEPDVLIEFPGKFKDGYHWMFIKPGVSQAKPECFVLTPGRRRIQIDDPYEDLRDGNRHLLIDAVTTMRLRHTSSREEPDREPRSAPLRCWEFAMTLVEFDMVEFTDTNSGYTPPPPRRIRRRRVVQPDQGVDSSADIADVVSRMTLSEDRD